jgi:hypothetical protein
VTHHAAEAWDFATRIAVLVGGRWAWQGPRPDDADAFHRTYQGLVRG